MATRMDKILWQPDEKRVKNANITEFTRILQSKFGRLFSSYSALHSWSVDSPSEFWEEVADYARIIFSHPPDRIFEKGATMRDSRWFSGARLNFAENLLRSARDETEGSPALVFRNETDTRIEISYGELYSLTVRVSHFLRSNGVRPGDRVAGFLPNQPETVIAMLAAASIGAVWSCCSPDFGESSLVERFSQIRPRVVFATTGYIYKGKFVDVAERALGLFDKVPGLERMVIVPYPGVDTKDQFDVSAYSRLHNWEDLLTQPDDGIEFCQTPFEHPVYILYTSGTTGVPKCVMHGAGGTLLQHQKELRLHTDLKKGDSIFFYTTAAWMMWHWVVSALAIGAKIVLYEGSPFFPSATHLWDIAQQENVNVFGAGARYFAQLQSMNAPTPLSKAKDLSALNTLLSTGSPLLHEQFTYIYENIKSDLCVSSISGGTDIISCFHLGNVALPVYSGQLQCAGLGMDVAFTDDGGKPVVGEKGELVCRSPFPSMPVSFWNDPDGSLYRDAYFKWGDENLWVHGDYGMTTPQNGAIIFGRSDATLNPGGVRVGPSEIYRQLEKVDEVADAVVIGQECNGDVRIILFVVTSSGLVDAGLDERIKRTIRSNLSPRHVPAVVLQVSETPRTLNGKLAELAVKEAFHGRPLKNLHALSNPECLEEYKALGEKWRESL